MTFLLDLFVMCRVGDFTYEISVRNESTRAFISTNRPKESNAVLRDDTTRLKYERTQHRAMRYDTIHYGGAVYASNNAQRMRKYGMRTINHF